MSTNLCSSVGGNTGGIGCEGKRKVPRKILAGSKQFPFSEYATPELLQAAILASINQPNGSDSKLFPFPEIGEVAETSTESTTGALALGNTRRLKKGIPGYTYTVEIGWYEYQKLLAFDGQTVPVFTFDDANQMWGYRAVMATPNTVNTNVWKGEMAYITVQGSGFEDGANAASGQATISVSYKSVDDFEKRGTYAILKNLAAGDMVGLQDVMLYEPSVHVSNVHKIAISIPLPVLGQDLNLYDQYGAILAGLTWAAATGANYGTPLTITSVTVDATNKCLTFTFDSTAYTALASNTKIRITPPTVSVLAGANMVGYEIGTIIVVKTP